MAGQTPREIDARLAELGAERSKHLGRIAHERRVAETLRRPVDEAAVARAQAEANRLATEMEPLEAAYRAKPWPRWFPCLNDGGHLHTSLSCETIRRDTRMGWATELSGRDAASVVAEYGTDVCTVCVPAAPTLPQPAYGSRSAQEKAVARAAREAARAAREARRAANRLVEPVLDMYGWHLHTVTEARRELADCLPFALELCDVSQYRAGIVADAKATLERIKAALVLKLGEEAVAELLAKAEKRARRQWRRGREG